MSSSRLPAAKASLVLALLLVAATLVLPVAAQTAVQSSPSTSAKVELEGAKLLSALRDGGYILYFRHASTDFSANDDGMTSFEDCAKQRNLTEQGRAEARAIGAAIRSLDIPIGSVLASPYCRTMETAKLAFGRATATNAVRGGPAEAPPERYAELRKLLSTVLSRGTNVVIASHGNPFRAVAGGSYLAEGEAAIVEPMGGDKFRIVARVRKDEWAALAK